MGRKRLYVRENKSSGLDSFCNACFRVYFSASPTWFFDNDMNRKKQQKQFEPATKVKMLLILNGTNI
jgi:hypothetical protein